MKQSEATIETYCDVCKIEDKSKAMAECCLCGIDICPKHCISVGTHERRSMQNEMDKFPDFIKEAISSTMEIMGESSNQSRVLQRTHAVCTNCAAKEPLMNIVFKLQKHDLEERQRRKESFKGFRLR